VRGDIRGRRRHELWHRCGNTAYLAPETLLGAPPDPRSDLYSLGVVLYELFTGKMPYEATKITDFLRAHLETPPVPPRRRVKTLPRELEMLILRLLCKTPEARFQSAAEVRRALEEVLAQAAGLNPAEHRSAA